MGHGTVSPRKTFTVKWADVMKRQLQWQLAGMNDRFSYLTIVTKLNEVENLILRAHAAQNIDSHYGLLAAL